MAKSRFVWATSAFLVCVATACGDDDAAAPAPTGPATAAPTTADAKHTYVTTSVLLGDDAETTYVSLLDNLDTQTVTFDEAREFPSWVGAYPHQGSLFLTGGESPTMTRYTIGDDKSYTESKSLSFISFGGGDSVFVGADKAFTIGDELVAWSPEAMSITGSSPLPSLPNRDAGLEWSGLAPGRNTVVRGNRTFIATSWANWESFEVSEDSVVFVIDNDTNQVVQQLAVPCPYVDVASLGDDGYVYLSNWVYSMPQTLLSGKKKACAARVAPGADTLDPTWSLTFADATEGREGAALHYIGENKALVSVFHHERVDLTAAKQDRAELTNRANWRFWVFDLVTKAAAPLEGIDFNAGGAYAARIDGRSFLLVPGSDYKETAVYEVYPKGTAELRWKTPGWSTFLGKLR